MTPLNPLRLILPVTLVLMSLGSAHVLRPAGAVDATSALSDLEQLKKVLKSSKSTNEDLDQWLRAVGAAYKDFPLPPLAADDAAPEVKKAAEDERARVEKLREKFYDDAEATILRVLVLVKIDPRDESNMRNEVNRKAAVLLGELAPLLDADGRKSLSRKIAQAIEKSLTKTRGYKVGVEHLEATFEALGKLNDHDTLAWMLKNYAHANEVQKQLLIAAHKSMILFKDVEGKLRYAICEQFDKVYTSVESQAETSGTDPKVQGKKRFWDDIKTSVIPVVQYYAGQPIGPDGAALATMSAFQAFMRDHKSERRAPWIDETADK